MKYVLSCIACFLAGAGSAGSQELPDAIDKSLYKPHVGVAVGGGFPDGGRGSGLEYTVAAGSRLYIDVPVLVGLELSTVEYGSRPANDDVRRVGFLFKSAYQFKSYRLRDFYAGLAMGPTWERAGSVDGLFFALAPHAGLEVPLRSSLSNDVSLGAELRYLVSSSDFPDGFSVNGTLKFWF